MIRAITYRGADTGLRLDGDNGDVLDVEGVRGQPDKMRVFVGAKRGAAGPRAASIELEPAEVVLLMEHCVSFLAAQYDIPVKPQRV